MIDFASSDLQDDRIARISGQPIALAAAVLVVLLAGVAAMALWRGYDGPAREPDQVVAARKLQARQAQVSEQLVEKTKGLEETQQESIDQLQLVQDQIQTLRRQLAAQQADNKRLSGQVSELTEAVDGLRQSLASAQAAEPASPSVRRHRPVRTRVRAVRTRPAGTQG